MAPAKEPVLLEDLISSVLRRLKPLLGRREVRVRVREDVPPVPVDVVQMDQVLTNVLENAVRYTAPGSDIAISAVRWQSFVELRISDRGPGIPENDLSRAFERFHLRSRHGRGSPDGAGLGLSIVRELAGAMGGSVDVENLTAGGACFTVRLPPDHP